VSKRGKGIKSLSVSLYKREKFYREHELNREAGSLRGAEPLFIKISPPSPFERGRGIKGDGVIQIILKRLTHDEYFGN
jgi:hypothetical protein